MITVLVTAAFALVLAFVLGTALGFFKDFFAVPGDPLADKIREALPGANCGACGFPGCDNYAKAVAAGNAGTNACTVGGPSVAEKIAALTGSSGGEVVQIAAVVACRGANQLTAVKGSYTGPESCRAAKIAGGIKTCSWGCLGFGDCVKVCSFGGISMNAETGLPVVDISKCTGCRLCAAECPQSIIKAVPVNQKGAIPLCSNRNQVKQKVAKSCKAGCIKCGICVKVCPQKCIDLGGNIPVIDPEKCTSCGTCVEKCPIKVLAIIEKDIF